MSIRVALNHRTTYSYDRPISLGPQTVRLRPAPHCRTPIKSYSLRISPEEHFLNWQQDPHGNFLARCVFPEKIRKFEVNVDLLVEMTVINPFDFFLEPSAEKYPFRYEQSLLHELNPYLEREPAGPKLAAYLSTVNRSQTRTIDFLVELNRKLNEHIEYVVRLEPGVQTCEETLTLGSGSCRDTGWLLVQVLRHLGLASRFTSGYLIQLKPDVKSLDGPSGAEQDFTDLHAWAEVFLPGAGWIGLDPTSGLLAGEGHIPLACTPSFQSAAPITGSHEVCETKFNVKMSVVRAHQDPRVTKPYTEEQWNRIDALGAAVDARLQAGDVRLTMGGEPTFVSVDNMDDPQWQTKAMGEEKSRLASRLIHRLRDRFSHGALLHQGQGKWYPGEPLPRWARRCYWRVDGQPIWHNEEFLADEWTDYGHDVDDARNFANALADRLGVNTENVMLAYEDVLYYLWQERRLPANLDLFDPKLKKDQERQRIAKILEQGISAPVGCVLPLQLQWWLPQPRWRSGTWKVRSDEMFLLPGDSPIGFRLPFRSLQRVGDVSIAEICPLEPFSVRPDLPPADSLRGKKAETMRKKQLVPWTTASESTSEVLIEQQFSDQNAPPGDSAGEYLAGSNGAVSPDWSGNGSGAHLSADAISSSETIETALCVEPRGGRLHVFMPPLDRLESYLELIGAIEDTAVEFDLPVIIEGYLPPTDHRIQHISVTPDPGVIEVNVQPAENWQDLKEIIEGVYEDAHYCRLGTEKFEVDGTHSGTGGGNHVVLGGPTPADSPLIRRPDLLRSLIGYWQNHPSLSYMFSGRFIGPTSQAPRVDEGRRDSLYELQIAFEEIHEHEHCPPWLVDRIFRNLLVDGTGNTHRSEFCIDKLYSPDTASGRLGLVEFRAFEMPPHARMSLTQQLLLRALVVRFWEEPYREALVDWGTSLHDRHMLPHFVWQDFLDVIEDTNSAGLALEPEWFAPHFEFRFPKIGELTLQSIHIELRQAIEPWYVLGEEPGANATARYVDSSVERLQVKVSAMTGERYVVTCNGRRLPLHPTGVEGEYIAGVRYRAWQPPNCLHPTIPVDEPLVFDLYDRWLKRSIGGCKYHVGHPGGLNPETFPVNAYEAESRRTARFTCTSHSGTSLKLSAEEQNCDFPMTLDLRRGRK